MWSRLQRPQEPFLCRRRKNLGPGRQFEEQLFENFEVELGIDVVEKKHCGLIKTTPEKSQFREFQEEDDHLQLPSRQHLGRRPSVDRKLEQVALRPDKGHPRPQLLAPYALKGVHAARPVADGKIADVVSVLRDDLRERSDECLGVRGPSFLDRSGRRGELRIPGVERRRVTARQERVALTQSTSVAADRFEIGGVDAGDAAIEKTPPFFRRAAKNVQARGRVGKNAHRVDVRRERHALAVDQQRTTPHFAGLQPDRKRLVEAEAVQQTGDEDTRRSELKDAGYARRTERLRRRQEVDRFEKVGLSLTVAADNDVDLVVKRNLVRAQVAEVLACKATENHEGLFRRHCGPSLGQSTLPAVPAQAVKRIGITTYRYSYARSASFDDGRPIHWLFSSFRSSDTCCVSTALRKSVTYAALRPTKNGLPA